MRQPYFNLIHMKRALLTSALIFVALSAFAQGYNSKGGSHRGYNSPYTQQQQQPSSWSGSGIAIGTKLIATNHHVVDGATNLAIYFPDTDKEYRAEVVTVDETHDLAVVRVVDSNFSGFNSIKYGFKDEVEDVGMGVFVLGYPLVQSMGTEIKLTTGVVSSRSGYQGDQSQYQISAPVQPGNSGGPLFNDNGELIGIVSAKHTEAENVSYGVKLSHLCTLANNIEGVNFNKSSQIAGMSLSEKCKSVIPCTVMVLANNARSSQPQQPQQSYTSGTTSGRQYSAGTRTYPIRINNPRVNRSNDPDVRIAGVEMTDKYTAIHMSWTNKEADAYAYYVQSNIHLYDSKAGKKYALITTENCAVAPDQSVCAGGQTQEFTLYFEPVPASTATVDLIEPHNDGWKFYGIEL